MQGPDAIDLTANCLLSSVLDESQGEAERELGAQALAHDLHFGCQELARDVLRAGAEQALSVIDRVDPVIEVLNRRHATLEALVGTIREQLPEPGVPAGF